jgi:hypothetical protein
MNGPRATHDARFSDANYLTTPSRAGITRDICETGSQAFQPAIAMNVSGLVRLFSTTACVERCHA